MIQEKKILIVIGCLFFLAFTACKTADTVTEKTPSDPADNLAGGLAQMFDTSGVFSNNFTGFALYDPNTEQMIYAQNEKRYFTPASNTKLFTFYTGLKLLPDSLPAFNYQLRGDSLFIWGTGDPSFLRADLHNPEVYNFLKENGKTIYYSDSHYKDTGLGPGWAWGDYQYAYSAEKSPFPMYGNVVKFNMREVHINTIQTNDKGELDISPSFFRKQVKELSRTKEQEEPVLSRGFADNNFRYVPNAQTSNFIVKRPYHYTPQLVVDMLQDTLEKPVVHLPRDLPDTIRTLYSIAADSAYKYMLQPSDNFIAEQLLLVATSELGKPLESHQAIFRMEQDYLRGMPDEPKWVDGSGLSRYNMFTPRSLIWLLQKIDAEFETDDKLFELLPAGGRSGTITNWYAPRDGGAPYVYAKTGTVRNNHCLSGYLITESGQKLMFSFMNNHYVSSSDELKEEMEKVLWYIHENY